LVIAGDIPADTSVHRLCFGRIKLVSGRELIVPQKRPCAVRLKRLKPGFRGDESFSMLISAKDANFDDKDELPACLQ